MSSSMNYNEIVIMDGVPYASSGNACAVELQLLEKDEIIKLMLKYKSRKELLMSDMLIKNGELMKKLNRILNEHIEEVDTLKNNIRDLEEQMDNIISLNN